MKFIKFLLSILLMSVLLTGFGCERDRQRGDLSNNKISYTNSISGRWIYRGSSAFGGEDGFTLELEIDGAVVSGTFSSVLNRVNPAVRIDAGAFNGTYDMKKQIIMGTWEGDRDDYGTFTAKFNPDDYTLTWNAEVKVSDNDYTIPRKMKLVKDTAEQISAGEEKKIIDIAGTGIKKRFPKGNYELSIIHDVQNIIVIEAAPGESEETDVVYIYLKRSGTGYVVVLGPGKKFTQKEYMERGIPKVVWVD